ncbi:MAG: nuclear transport factor 2 family protein [Thermoleophilaceae bacterium]
MSDATDAVRLVVDAINRVDLERFADAISEDFEIDFSNSRSPMSGVYRGRDQAQEFLRSFLEPWSTLEFHAQELIELKGGRVLQVGGLRSRGHGSGVEVEASGATVWTIRDGEVAAVKLYQSKEEALEAS